MRSLHVLFTLALAASSASALSEAQLGERAVDSTAIETLLNKYSEHASQHVKRFERSETTGHHVKGHHKRPKLESEAKVEPLEKRGEESLEALAGRLARRALGPNGSRDHHFSEKMNRHKMKKGLERRLRSRRAMEGPPPGQEKRWIQGPSIIQDSSPTEGLPAPGANVNYFDGVSGTPVANGLVAPTFAPLADPTALANIPGLSLPSQAAVAPNVNPVQAQASPAPIIENAQTNDSHLDDSANSVADAIGNALKSLFGFASPAATPVPVAAAPIQKRWVWGGSIIQDGSPTAGLPDPGAGNVINFPGYPQNTPGPMPVAPTFLPLPPGGSNGNLPGLNAPNWGATPVVVPPPSLPSSAPAVVPPVVVVPTSQPAVVIPTPPVVENPVVLPTTAAAVVPPPVVPPPVVPPPVVPPPVVNPVVAPLSAPIVNAPTPIATTQASRSTSTRTARTTTTRTTTTRTARTTQSRAAARSSQPPVSSSAIKAVKKEVMPAGVARRELARKVQALARRQAKELADEQPTLEPMAEDEDAQAGLFVDEVDLSEYDEIPAVDDDFDDGMDDEGHSYWEEGDEP